MKIDAFEAFNAARTLARYCLDCEECEDDDCIFYDSEHRNKECLCRLNTGASPLRWNVFGNDLLKK